MTNRWAIKMDNSRDIPMQQDYPTLERAVRALLQLHRGQATLPKLALLVAGHPNDLNDLYDALVTVEPSLISCFGPEKFRLQVVESLTHMMRSSAPSQVLRLHNDSEVFRSLDRYFDALSSKSFFDDAKDRANLPWMKLLLASTLTFFAVHAAISQFIFAAAIESNNPLIIAAGMFFTVTCLVVACTSFIIPFSHLVDCVRNYSMVQLKVTSLSHKAYFQMTLA